MLHAIRFSKQRAYGSVLLRVTVVLIAALSIAPIIYLMIRAAETGADFWVLLTRPRTLRVFNNSLLLTALVTASSTFVGSTLAWLTMRTDLPGRRIWAALTCLPLVLPSYVGAFALLAALGPKGMLQSLLVPLGVDRLPSIYGLPGAWLALTLFTYPYVQLSVRAGLRGLDPALEDAARCLGLRRAQVFRQIVLPHLRPAIGAGALLVALYTLSDFGAVSLLQFNVFTREIYIQYSATLDRSAAAVLAIKLVVLTGMIILIEGWTRSHCPQYRAGTGTARKHHPVPLGAWRYPAILLCTLVTLLGLGIPILVTSFWLFRGLQASSAIGAQTRLLWNSVSVSALAALSCTLAALPVVIQSVRHPGRLSRTAERAAYAGHALPGIVVALALVFFGARYAPYLYQSRAMLVVAYTILFLPLALGALRTAMLKINPRTEEAARTLGRAPPNVLRSVTMPQLRPGLLTGMALVFLTCMKELPATLLLGPTGFETLATRIWSATEEAFFAMAAAPALILMLAAAISLWIILQHEQDQVTT
ncbi:MAG: ABC transporter permease [Kiritimatiellia bacterium]